MFRNQVSLVGRLTKDITIRKTQAGDSVTSFSLAINDGKDAQGNDKAIFVQCNAWKGTADLLARYCKKGDRIGVEGHLTQRKWEEKQVTLTEVTVEGIEFLQGKREESNAIPPMAERTDETLTLTITDDDLPF